jgi:SAM-dependent methyltransferase
MKNGLYSKSLKLAFFAMLALQASSDVFSMEKNPHQERKPDEAVADPKIVLGKRPESVQDKVDKTFAKIFEYDTLSWAYNGTYPYGIFGLDDDKLIKYIVSNSPGNVTDIFDIGCGTGYWGRGVMTLNVIYIIDIGCGTGDWGRSVVNLLVNIIRPEKTVKVISVTGGSECANMICGESHDIIIDGEIKGNVTLYQLNRFKIENIVEEFRKRGFNLEGTVNLIVSSWTLMHLTDPFGTLKQMYSLLTPSQGILIADNFFFEFFDDSKKIQSPIPDITCNPTPSCDIFSTTNAVPLFRAESTGRSILGSFLLMRNDDQELAIPLAYTGKTHELPVASAAFDFLTIFKKGIIKEWKPFCLETQKYGSPEIPDGAYYCNEHNQLSKDLYEQLKNHGLFNSDL